VWMGVLRSTFGCEGQVFVLAEFVECAGGVWEEEAYFLRQILSKTTSKRKM
jgi:hypothetical protein